MLHSMATCFSLTVSDLHHANLHETSTGTSHSCALLIFTLTDVKKCDKGRKPVAIVHRKKLILFINDALA